MILRFENEQIRNKEVKRKNWFCEATEFYFGTYNFRQ